MKQRIITALCWGAFAVVLLVLNITHPVLLNIVLAVVACVGLYEVLVATKFIKNPVIAAMSFLLTLYLMFLPLLVEDIYVMRYALTGFVVYLIIIFMVMLLYYPKYEFAQIASAALITLLVCGPFFSALCMYWYNPYGHVIGQCMIILCMLIAWMTDTGAYFTGVICGKHKLAELISPKKTIEGAIGGIIFCVGIVSAIAYLCTGYNIVTFEVNWINLVVITVIGSIISMIGDLTFSVIKRSCGIKDFGNIMPGHGGILDRFDSLIFVFPFVSVMNMFMPMILGAAAA